jgi:hypothetical protein
MEMMGGMAGFQFSVFSVQCSVTKYTRLAARLARLCVATFSAFGSQWSSLLKTEH